MPLSGKRYPEKFKNDAVKHIVDRGHSVFSVATRLDITTQCPIAYRLSPIAYRLSPIAYRLTPDVRRSSGGPETGRVE
jgi:hypothetical protein